MDEISLQSGDPMSRALALSANELAAFFPAFLKLDAAGAIIDAGPSLLRHLGQQILGKSFFDVMSMELPGTIADVSALQQYGRAILLRCIEFSPMRLRGLVVNRDDGIWLLLGHIPDPEADQTVQPLQIADFSPTDGTLDMMLAADMRAGLLSETRVLASELETRREEAEAANRAKSAFLTTMSHEIRTPMNAVLGIAGILAETEITPEQRAWLKIMDESGRSLMELLDNILDLSKIESGSMQITSEEFDLKELCAAVHALYRPIAAEKGLDIVLKTDLKAALYKGDPVRIRQILVNLVGNAIKFTEAGKIVIHLRDRKMRSAPHLEMSVSDTGIGIAKEVIPQLFKPFMQADCSTTRRYGGSGLGLSISKRLTEQMGGDIAVESRVGRGSVFTVTLPIETAAPSVRPEAPTGAGQIPPQHILIVDDNRTNRIILSHYLKQLGHSFDIAVNGQEALAAWEHANFDLIIMDIEMPVMDGLEATREIRRREYSESHNRTPILALSADAMLEKRQLALSVGMDDYVTKPVVLSELQARIELVCSHAISK